MNKKEKVEFVKKLKKELKSYKTIAVMDTGKTPDNLVQKVRNQLKPDSKFVAARKSLLKLALEGDENHKKLETHLDGNVMLILTNKSPSELNEVVSGNRIKLLAKPNQISPENIDIESGETSIAPGQAVTDLKAAGIDVKIDKGKVVISKSKTLVKKGEKISTAISKALKMLDVMPFEASTKLRVVLEGDLVFTEQALGINVSFVQNQIMINFSQANALTLAINYVTQYNVDFFVKKGYLSALTLGVDRNIYEPDVVEKLLAKAFMQAKQTEPLIKSAEPEAPKADAPAAEEKKPEESK